MTTDSLIRLFLLAAIWGASFLFLRILVPTLGALQTTELRVLIAGFGMLAYARATGLNCDWKKMWKHYLAIGVINSALPFSLFAWGANHLPSSFEVILNSSAPLFSVIFSAIWLGDKLTVQKLAGLALGAAGVTLIAGFPGPGTDAQLGVAVVACLVGASCYGLAAIYIRKFAGSVKPAAMAACSQIMAAAVLSPVLFHLPSVHAFTPLIIGALLSLALICSGAAYLLYFRLLADAGPARALTVTFLMPMFGMLWGFVFLHETITSPMIGGCVLIVSGTACVLGFIKSRRACAPETPC